METTYQQLTFVEAARPPGDWLDRNTGTRFHRVLRLPSVDTRLELALPAFLSAALGTRLHGLCAGLVDRDGRLVSVTAAPFSYHPVLTVVVGRHSHADLRALEPELALRHLALVYARADAGAVRAFDLRAEAATTCRDGATVHATRAGLPTVFQLGSYLLLVAATPLLRLDGDALVSLARFGSYAEVDGIAPGTPFSFRLQDFGQERPARAPLRFCASSSLGDFALPGAERGMEPTIELTGIHAQGTPGEHWFRPSFAKLARGVLIGRYERCDAPAGSAYWSENLSRVHALLFCNDSRTYICDVASSFGVRHETLGHTRLKHVRAGDVFWLGSCRLSVEEAFS